MNYKIGDKVVARMTITEGGVNTTPDPDAKYPEAGYIHALVGENGVIIHESARPTVRFARTGTATIVEEHEIEKG